MSDEQSKAAMDRYEVGRKKKKLFMKKRRHDEWPLLSHFDPIKLLIVTFGVFLYFLFGK